MVDQGFVVCEAVQSSVLTRDIAVSALIPYHLERTDLTQGPLRLRLGVLRFEEAPLGMHSNIARF